MTLDEALTRIKELETKLDALEAAPADDAAKCPDCGAALVDGEEHTCAPKMDAADAARIEGERDAAKAAAEEAKAAAEQARKDAEETVAKVRKDADESVSKKVREALDVLSKAVMVLGKDSKIKLDGKDVELIDAPLRAVKCAVIKHLKGKTIAAEKLDAYVDALFEDAMDGFKPGATSVAAAKAVVTPAVKTDAAAPAPAKDPETAATDALKDRYASAWMASNKSEDK